MSDNPVHRHIGKLMKHHQEQSFLIHSFCPDYHCDAIGFMVVLIHLVHLVGGNLKILGTEQMCIRDRYLHLHFFELQCL